MARLFISYSRDDNVAFVDALVEELAYRQRHQVWLDKKSMPSRGHPFVHEMRTAIDECDKVLLVWGPTAHRKEYVRLEWEHAWNSCKVMIPIVVGVPPDTLPEELSALPAMVISDARQSEGCFAELERHIREPDPELGAIWRVPERPERFLRRPDEFRALRRLVIGDQFGPERICGNARATLIHGLPGAGKSVIAADFVRCFDARRGFPHGIYWLEAPVTPKPGALRSQLAEALGENGATAERLSAVLKDRSICVVADNAAGRAELENLLHCLGPNGRLLATSTNASAFLQSGMSELRLDVLNDDASLRLLAELLQRRINDEPLAGDLVALCGGLPLAIALNAGMLRAGWPWDRVVAELRSGNLDFAHGTLKGYVPESVARALSVSFAALDDRMQSRVRELSVFVADQSLPVSAVKRFWRETAMLEAAATEDLLVHLSQRAFVRLEWGELHETVHLHGLVRAFLKSQVEDQAALNRVLIQSYARERENVGQVEDDGYFFRCILRHLLQDNATSEAHALLTASDPDGSNTWFNRLDQAGLASAFVADLERLFDHTAEIRRSAGSPDLGLALLGRAHAYAVMASSIVTRARRLGPELLTELASAGFSDWPIDRVLAHAFMQPSVVDRAQVLALTWNRIPAASRERLEASLHEWLARSFYPHRRADIYSSFIAQLETPKVRHLLSRIAGEDSSTWTDSHSYQDTRWSIRVSAARRFAEAGERDEAVEIALALPRHHFESAPLRDGIRAVLGHLDIGGCRRLHNIGESWPSAERAWLLAQLAGRFAELGAVELALDAARSTEPEWSTPLAVHWEPDLRLQAWANALRPSVAWPSDDRIRAEREALALANDVSDRARAYSAAWIAGVLREHPETVRALATEVLEFQSEDISRQLYLEAVAPRLPERARYVALRGWLDETASQISLLHGETRLRYLGWLIPIWPGDKLAELPELVEEVPLLARWRFELQIAKRRNGRGASALLRAVIRESLKSDDVEFCSSAIHALRSRTVAPGLPVRIPPLELEQHLAEIEKVITDRARGEEFVPVEADTQQALRSARGEPRFSIHQRVEAGFRRHWPAARLLVLENLQRLSPGLERAAGTLWVASLLEPAERREFVGLAVETLRARPHDQQGRSLPPFLAALPTITRRSEVEELDRRFEQTLPVQGGNLIASARCVLSFARRLGSRERSRVASALFELARGRGEPTRIDIGELAISHMAPGARKLASQEFLAWANTIDDDPYGKAIALAAAACDAPPDESRSSVRTALNLSSDLEEWMRANVLVRLARHRSPDVAEMLLDLAGELAEPFRVSVLKALIANGPPTGWGRIVELIDSVRAPWKRCILLGLATRCPDNPLRRECLGRAVSAVLKLDLQTVPGGFVEHLRQLLALADPEQASSILELFWRSLSRLPRQDHVKELLLASPSAGRIDPTLCSQLASNLDQVVRWWP